MLSTVLMKSEYSMKSCIDYSHNILRQAFEHLLKLFFFHYSIENLASFLSEIYYE